MSNADSTGHRQQPLADGFARRLIRWACAANPEFSATHELGEAARQVCFAMADGHVCTDLSILSERLPGTTPESLRGLLLGSGMVGTPGDVKPLPLVLDDGGRLYSYRYFDYERRLAAALTRLADTAGAPPHVLPAAHACLGELFGPACAEPPDWQKIAVAAALLNRLTIISGGPGTGKTTTVVNLLACLLAGQPDCRIALAAPTGKAAARLLGAVTERAAQLPASVRDGLPQTAFTIHRLLGVLRHGGFRYHAENPLAVDVLIVDEASMLDLALATRLIEAVPPGARVVLLGDRSQLAAVEAGAVFAELASDPGLEPSLVRQLAELTDSPPERLVTPPPVRPTPLSGRVLWFVRNYRFREDSGIGRLAAYVNGGDWAAAQAWLAQGGDQDVSWQGDRSGVLSGPSLARLIDGYREFLEVLRDAAAEPSAAIDAFGRFRVLCAIRESARGAVALNRALAADFRRALGHPFDRHARSDWFPGRPVMILRNEYTLRLFNGDIGIALADANGSLRVHFPDGAGAFRVIPPARLPEHETAFAMTVHKSQGSEFDGVALILPARPMPVVTRELIYTGITRARRRVDLFAAPEVLAAGIASPTRRQSGLIERLQAAARQSQTEPDA